MPFRLLFVSELYHCPFLNRCIIIFLNDIQIISHNIDPTYTPVLEALKKAGLYLKAWLVIAHEGAVFIRSWTLSQPLASPPKISSKPVKLFERYMLRGILTYITATLVNNTA